MATFTSNSVSRSTVVTMKNVSRMKMMSGIDAVGISWLVFVFLFLMVAMVVLGERKAEISPDRVRRARS